MTNLIRRRLLAVAAALACAAAVPGAAVPGAAGNAPNWPVSGQNLSNTRNQPAEQTIGAATAAQLDRPISLAFDKGGNLYVADSSQTLSTGGVLDGYTRIRRIDGTGKIQTIAGGGTLNPDAGAYAPAVHFGPESWITIDGSDVIYLSESGVTSYGPQFVAAVDSGLLRLIADRLVEVSGGRMATAGYMILWASAFLSAIIDNIPFVATMIPLIKSMAPAMGGADRIEPLWWCLSLGACLGGNGTLIGASANLTVAGLAERNGVPFRFATYVLYGLPMMIVSVALSHIYVWWRYF